MSATLPRWDMSVVFPSIESSEYISEVASVTALLSELEGDFDAISPNVEENLSPEVFDRVVPKLNVLIDRAGTLVGYVSAFTTTDTRDEKAQAALSELDFLFVRFRKLRKRFDMFMGQVNVEALVAGSAYAADHKYTIQQAAITAKHLMSAIEEELASDLDLTGATAWEKLYSNVTSQIVVPIDLEDATTMPMSMVRALATDASREKRRKAYESELSTWRDYEVPVAAALNAIKGQVLTLAAKRNWADPLDESIFGANIDRATLDAMMSAAKEAFPDFRRYLKAKAKLLGVPTLAWFDLFAPIPGEQRNWEYEEACTFVADQFGTFSDEMKEMALRSYRENWIDVEPRPGKVDGAFCMSLRGDESRVLLNFRPAFGAVSTLAHELGHAYHNVCVSERTGLQRELPMTLAETASIFCETIIRQASLKIGTVQEQTVILEASLQGSCQVVVDISSRFLFEQSVFEMRKSRELSPAEISEAMRQAQLATYGDGLDESTLHTYMWAAKPHYYSTGSYYNYPYMFGQLFALGLYSVYLHEGPSFVAKYRELLSKTGMADAASLAQEFGIDIRSIEFWRGSLDLLRADIDRFESIVNGA